MDKSNESESHSNVVDKSNESQSQSNVVESNVVGKSNESQSQSTVESNVQSENNVVAGFGWEAPMDEEPPVVSDSSQGPSPLEVAEQYG